ncbi:tRNA nucleotidyltransferase/poly(A) polymerase [Planctomycetes bacterium CA13]|uniref:tRNA nucleotidyltransferase/poly(A) polymerase n=1 Tax=Novipirellula herctigrandis TaxID=2527986 RepID=A0A5C5Z8F1_9BACT|nr:tRNA nucleotidyltransferase/poly(A) polymerase [Planctomycetes bacterium CA13]
MKPNTTPFDFPVDFQSDEDAAEAIRIIDRLREAGFIAYFAGGCVRDALLGNKPKDYDIATDAVPDAIQTVFGKRQTLAFGASFGVIGVLPSKERRQRAAIPLQPIEVATFRSDGTYTDGRRPDSVHFGTAEADAVRRDFTINGLFYDPTEAIIVDYVSGTEDLDKKILRTIGSPNQRFDEDKLRMLRAVRFTTTLGFSIAPSTAAAIRENAAKIDSVSSERVGVEMRRTMMSENVLDGIDHLTSLALGSHVLPEIEDINSEQFHRLFAIKKSRPFVVALAGFLFATKHPRKHLKAITRRWRLSNVEVRQVDSAIRFAPIIAEADQRAWSQIQPILIDRDANIILEVSRMIAGTNNKGVALSTEALRWSNERLDPQPLIGGSDLASQGIPKGPAYAKILKQIRDLQLDNKLHSKDEALKYAAKIHKTDQP